jgi:hypothetical protein
MKRIFYISVVALLASCASAEWPDVERGEQELKARDIVWQSFGATQESPPYVSWETGEQCPNGNDGNKYIVLFEKDDYGHLWKCLLGRYHEPEHQAWVAFRDKISSSAYAHELYHGWLWVHTGDPDSAHLGPGWTTIVWHANDLLRAEGL